ncbi:unnamed protein product [Nippostrongylus brasiliensis]|uniref:Endo/exonuclease/phosphatase domain-containing protein n=1 Tax=Nippostrongylus brasiliensis TaxID=27835 RepID=A0A0N4XFQ2_NIPBR|nr:unnamed protein product [Nippostrongylus brasiliensis]
MKDGCWIIISVYPPQTECSDREEEKDEFYMTLGDVIRSVPEGDFLTVAGDLNGHVGTERRGLERVHGRRRIGCKNEDGERIIDLAVSNDLAICSTFFAKRKSQKVTYSSQGRRTEIDYILVRRQALKTVKDVKVLPGEDVTTQRKPLVADLNITLPPKRKVKMERRIRWWKL